VRGYGISCGFYIIWNWTSLFTEKTPVGSRKADP